MVLATFDWKRQGRSAAIARTTDAFPTSDAATISIEFALEGRGRFFIEKLEFRLLDAKIESTEP